MGNYHTCTSNGKLSRSSPKTITCGVPQGSILSPLLFSLCINDMPESLNYSTPSLYADDTEIYASSNDCVDLVPKVNNDLENIRKWMIKNKLQIHPSKSKHMFVAYTYRPVSTQENKHRIGSDWTFFILYYPQHRTKKVENTSTLYLWITGSNWNRKLVPKAHARV